jgi:hypothetical protein
VNLPSRAFSDSNISELEDRSFVTVGCVSFEQRCTAVPLRFWSAYGERAGIHLFELEDPPDGVPDYGEERKQKVEQNGQALRDAGVKWTPITGKVLDAEDALLRHVESFVGAGLATVVLDITSLPKRYFCFFLRRLITMSQISDVVVTYTDAGAEGYTKRHLAEDVMTPESFPGFGGKFTQEDNLVVSVGFEPLGLRSLILLHYRETVRNLRIVLPFPAPIETVRRQWNTLREIMEDDPANLRRNNVAVIGAWDAEYVYRTLVSWMKDGNAMSLAPFGPKPHTLGMALFAIEHDASLWYTQPKVYHPDYSRGVGQSRWYIVKWRGVPCFAR